MMMMMMLIASVAIGFEGDLPIFKKGRSVYVSYKKCGNDRPVHFVRVDQNKWTINWKWLNKSQAWCGWGIENLPTSNLAEYMEGNLVIKYLGSYQGKSPEVKFIDFDDNHTNLISFTGKNYQSGQSATGATVKIPIKAFFGDDPDFYPANPSSIRVIQFDAEYNSTNGKIKITYIGLTKQ